MPKSTKPTNKKRRPQGLFQLVCVVGPQLRRTSRRGHPMKMAANDAAQKNDRLLREGAGCYWKPVR